MRHPWTDDYPDKGTLKAEALAMARVIGDAVLALAGAGQVRGLYFKGSARREWQSLVDYVPEISDVDVHAWLVDDRQAARFTGDMAVGLAMQERIERAYAEAVPRPLHLPRPQLMFLNSLKQDPAYVPSPADSVTVLYGEAYPTTGKPPPEETARLDRERLLADVAVAARMAGHVMDRPGRYLWESIRAISWRVAPTGPRLLTLAGWPPDGAWRLSRSEIVEALHGLDAYRSLAGDYAGFYLATWDYFLSGLQDTTSARRAVARAVNLLLAAGEIAQSAGPPPGPHPSTAAPPGAATR